MRTIAFRIWDNAKKKTYEHALGWGGLQGNGLFYREFDNRFLGEWIFGGDYVLEQATGLCDATGQMIYEHDLVNSRGDTWRIIFKNGSFRGIQVGKPARWRHLCYLVTAPTLVIGMDHSDESEGAKPMEDFEFNNPYAALTTEEAITSLTSDIFFSTKCGELRSQAVIDNTDRFSEALDRGVTALGYRRGVAPADQGMSTRSGNWTVVCAGCGTRTENARRWPQFCCGCGQAFSLEADDDRDEIT